MLDYMKYEFKFGDLFEKKEVSQNYVEVEMILPFQASSVCEESLNVSGLAHRIVLVELGNSIFAEEGHIFAKSESEVVHVILLLEHYLVTQGLAEPGNIGRGRKSIKVTRHEHSWHIVVLNGNKRHLTLTIDFLVLDWAIVIARELLVVDHLRVVDECAIALTRWLVAHEDIKTSWVVDTIFVVDVRSNGLASIWKDAAD